MRRILPFLVFAYIALSFACHPQSPFYTHHLADPDDYMRLDEVIAWLRGQSWHDLSVPRLSSGAHTIIHWSRLIDLPIAAVMLPFISAFGIANAAMIASFIVPFLWLALLMILLVALEKTATRADSRLSPVFLLFAPMLLFNYTPGRVDHHGAQAIIAGFGLLSLGRILHRERGALFAILSALFFACGFWIGAEALPWAMLFIACLGIAAAWQGGNIARNGALFGLALPLFTAAAIPVALPATAFSSRALSWFSPAYALFAALAGAVLAIGWGLGRLTDKKFLRLALYASGAFAAAAVFLFFVPSAMGGIFTDYDTFDATTALDNIREAVPLTAIMHINFYIGASIVHAALIFARVLFLPLAALIGCSLAAKSAQGATRGFWLAQAAFLLAALLLTLFWQNRVGIFMEMFMLAPLAWVVTALWARLRWRLWDRPLFWAEITVFCIFTMIPVLILPALAAQTPLYPDILLFPAARGASACNLNTVLPVLNDPQTWGARAHTIMNISDDGPQLLFTTGDNVVAGNFDVSGNADAFAFFNAKSDAPARAAARKWHADLVLLCREAPTLYLGRNYGAISHGRLETAADGKLHWVNTDAHQPLIERLLRGPIPLWLKPIEIPGGSDYLLFQVQDTGKK